MLQMSTPNQPIPNPTSKKGTFSAQSVVVEQQPDAYPALLSEMEFQVLKDGETSTVKASRDQYFSIAVSTGLSAIGLCFSVAWDRPHKIATVVLFALCVVSLASFLAALNSHKQYISRNNGTAHSSLMQRLERHFSSAGADQAT
jgi:hypothetical protein